MSPLREAIRDYSDAVVKHGPESPEAAAARKEHLFVPEFQEMARIVDKLYRCLRAKS